MENLIQNFIGYIYPIYNTFYRTLYYVMSMFFEVISFRVKNDSSTGQTRNILWKYYLVKIFYYLNFIFDLEYPRFINYLDSPNQVTKICLTNGSMVRNILFKNKNIRDIIINLQSIDVYNENHLMMNKRYPVLDIFLENDNGENLKIKDLINNYADEPRLFEHVLRHIFEYKNIGHEKYKKIKIVFLKLIKRETREYRLEDILDRHISELFIY